MPAAAHCESPVRTFGTFGDTAQSSTSGVSAPKEGSCSEGERQPPLHKQLLIDEAPRRNPDISSQPDAEQIRAPHNNSNHGKKKNFRPHQTRACMEKAITAWGWTFDVFLIAVNITDVISDCLIARQFWVDGHKTFFWLVLASLIIASLIYAFVGVEYLLRERMHNTWHRAVQYPIMLVFSQLVPVLNWFIELKQPQSGSSEEERWTSTFGRSEFTTAVAAEEIGSMQSSAHIMQRLDVALVNHLRSHALFYVESIVEAIPQSIVQLLAVSFLGEASALQVFSLALSMVSIMSKGYVLSRSFAVPEIAFKFFLGCHDLFSLFYAFATILSNMSSPDVSLGGGVSVDYLSFVWLVKILALWGYAALVAAVLGVIVAKETFTRGSCEWRLFGHIVGGFFLGLLGVGPAVIAIEGSKLLWFNAIITDAEPQSNIHPLMSLWYGFCNSAATVREFYNRFRYISLRVIDHRYSEEARQSQITMFRRRRTTNAKQHRRRENDGPVSPLGPTTTQPENVWADRRAQPLRKLSDTAPKFVRDSIPALTETPFHPWRLVKDLHAENLKSRLVSPTSWKDQFAVGVGMIALLLYGIGQLYSLAFPFLHFGINHGHQNLLQCFCFYGTAATFFVLVCFAPRVVRYCLFLAMSYNLSRSALTSRDSAKIERFIEDYFIPQPAHFIAKEIDPALLPSDLVGVVASFLRRDDLDLRDITIEDCNAVAAKMMQDYVFEMSAGCNNNHMEEQHSAAPPDAAAGDDNTAYVPVTA